jgi:hypothetical protein
MSDATQVGQQIFLLTILTTNPAMYATTAILYCDMLWQKSPLKKTNTTVKICYSEYSWWKVVDIEMYY